MHVCEVVGSLVLCAGLVGCAGGKSAQRSDPPNAVLSPSSAQQSTAAPGSAASQEDGATKNDPQRQINVAVDPKLQPPRRAAWMAYALGIASQRIKSLKEGLPIDRIAEESTGLRAAVSIWAESDKQSVTDDYLTSLAKVVEAGFIDEYVLRFLSKPGWNVRPERIAALKLGAFSRWAEKNLAKHRVQRGSEVSFGSDRTPIGSELAERFPDFKPSECGTVKVPLAALIKEWEARRPQLPERLYSSSNPGQFFRSIERLQAASSVSQQPLSEVHWISPSVGNLYNAAAFCAIEAKDGRWAETYLRKAIQINPAHANGYGELAFVLIHQRRYADALAEIEQGMMVTDDPCLQAMLWRKRGYVFIELDQLVAARGAYLHSLELAPSNQLALSELQIIEGAMRERGMPVEPAVSGAPGSIRVPNIDGTVISTCE